MLNIEPNIEEFVERIIEILKADPILFSKDRNQYLTNIIYGRPPDERSGAEKPYAYVCPADNPIDRRQRIGRGDPSPELLYMVYWVVVVADDAETEISQRRLSGIVERITEILKRNPRLQNTDGEFGLCRTLTVSYTPRYIRTEGSPVQAFTIIVKPEVYLAP